jgi:hypothetical protein
MPEIPKWKARTATQGVVEVVIDVTGVYRSEKERQEYYARFSRRRGEVAHHWDNAPPALAEVDAALGFLRFCEPTKRSTMGAFLVRQMAERWSRARRLSNGISMGAVISAAVRLGLTLDLRVPGPGCGIAIKRLSAERAALRQPQFDPPQG